MGHLMCPICWRYLRPGPIHGVQTWYGAAERVTGVRPSGRKYARSEQGEHGRILHKANKSAIRKGHRSAWTRLWYDRAYAQVIAAMPLGKYPVAFIAAAVMALQQAPGASALAIGGDIIPVGSLAIEGVLWGSLPAHPGTLGIIFTLLCLIVGSFFLGCATGVAGPCCFCRRCLRAIRAFCHDPAATVQDGSFEQGNVRTVGVMSQCHYSWFQVQVR